MHRPNIAPSSREAGVAFLFGSEAVGFASRTVTPSDPIVFDTSGAAVLEPRYQTRPATFSHMTAIFR